MCWDGHKASAKAKMAIYTLNNLEEGKRTCHIIVVTETAGNEMCQSGQGVQADMTGATARRQERSKKRLVLL